MNNEQPKFSLVEIILGSLFALVLDGLSALVDGLTKGFGGFVIQSFGWGIFALWFTFKGVKATASLIKRIVLPWFIQLVPFLPTLFFTFLITTYVENHPEKFGVLEKAKSLKGKIPKGFGKAVHTTT